MSEHLQAFRGRRVLVTGNTGFKGSWLTLWLTSLGATVSGYSLGPPTEPNLHDILSSSFSIDHHEGDVRDLARLRQVVRAVGPEVVFHLAAQPIVRRSYAEPVETVETNFMGTVKLLEAIRLEGLATAVVVITSDKCYDNREWIFGYRETDVLGGYDVYSMSKAAAELAVDSYRRSFFPADRLEDHGVPIATVRAGNVIGGGDWAEDRIVCDMVRALSRNRPIPMRNSDAVRPWQHVIEPLSGYLAVAEGLLGEGRMPRERYCTAWNFGPTQQGCRTVRELADEFIASWGSGSIELVGVPGEPHEARLLTLSIEKANTLLRWNPRWQFPETVQRTAEWYRAFYGGEAPSELAARCLLQIADYMAVPLAYV